MKYKGKGFSGLGNLGNTCYMNSVLQCLSQCLQLTDFFLTKNTQEDILVEIYTKTIREMWRENAPIAPKSLKKVIDDYIPLFRGNNQHDCHEFLIKFLEILHDKTKIKRIKFEINPNSSKNIQKAFSSWETHVGVPSIISDLFYGQFSDSLRCEECYFSSTVYDPFLTLEIPVYKGDYTVKDHLSRYFKFDYTYKKCENCSSDSSEKTEEHEIQRGIFLLPKILVISFSRFDALGKKKTENIHLSKELDMTEYSRFSTQDSVMYDLSSVICHSGESSTSGHYFSVIKDNYDDGWNIFNDQIVAPYNLDNLDVSTPYILFYKQRN